MAGKNGARLDPEDRREQILGIAAEHFARRGAARASVSAIAEDAGVTRALVYHYFPGKDALAAAVTRYEADRILRAIQPDPGLEPGRAIRWALETYFDEVTGQGPGHGIPFPLSGETPSTAAEAQLDWLLECAAMPATAATRLALTGWLAMVEHVAREQAAGSEVPRADAVELCVRALEGMTGQEF